MPYALLHDESIRDGQSQCNEVASLLFNEISYIVSLQKISLDHPSFEKCLLSNVRLEGYDQLWILAPTLFII